VIVVTFVILMVVDLEPLTKQFLTSLVIGLLVTRLLWIFQSQLMLSLILGYELDRALILRKSEASLFEKISKLWVTSSGKVFASSEKGDASTVPSTHHQSIGSGSAVDDQLMMRGLEKYSKMKNKAELDGEIERVKEQIKRHQVELACLENMIFASEHDSISLSGRRSSHGDRGVIILKLRVELV
jgi:hypothetical protein